jgi:hypothetical protein
MPAPSVTIPVSIPSIAIVHTTDISLDALPASIDGASPVLTCNQLVAATLSLKWSRIWDTESVVLRDREFAYDVVAPSDAWLVGGRKRGHFVIPGSDAETGESGPLMSEEATEAAVPIVLVPLREGWLPWPSVEMSKSSEGSPDVAVNAAGGGTATTATVGAAAATGGGGGGSADCEIDSKNLGEVVRVVGDRRSVTVSLDASGPGGGPLVLDVQGGRDVMVDG